MKHSALLLGLSGAAGSSSGCFSPTHNNSNPEKTVIPTFELEEVSVTELQAGLASGRFTSAGLVRSYRRRIQEIDHSGPLLRSVIELNPEAEGWAAELDRERKAGKLRSPLHGVPILIKDNIDTHDRMQTTAGSLALEGSIAPQDAFVVGRLRAAGVVILGKTNLSEWANFRGSRSISGWSGRGGLTRNPYATDRSTSGSSAGSAAAVSASLCAISIGTETDGSIVSPASYCGIVGIKPTVGLVSRSGIIPISSSQDTAGPMARTVADAAVLLGIMAGKDPWDPATSGSDAGALSDYTRFLDATALRGARLGVMRGHFKMARRVDPVMEATLEAMRHCGAILVEDAKPPARGDFGDAEYLVMLYEFKEGLNSYLRNLGPMAAVHSLEDVIAFNERNSEREMPFFGQETLIEAQAKGSLSDPKYLDAVARCARWSRDLEETFEKHRLDAWIAPTTGPAHVLDLVVGDRGLGGSSTYAAVSGLPSITVPGGNVSGLPIGVSFIGRRWSEGRLIALAHAFERATRARIRPRYLSTLPLG